jgi:hypothetical protein
MTGSARIASDEVDDAPPEVLAEQHLMHRILVATAFAIPLGAGVLAALVGGATAIAGQPAAISALVGAGIGALAGAFFGVWAGFVASIRELDDADLPRHVRSVEETSVRSD